MLNRFTSFTLFVFVVSFCALMAWGNITHPLLLLLDSFAITFCVTAVVYPNVIQSIHRDKVIYIIITVIWLLIYGLGIIAGVLKVDILLMLGGAVMFNSIIAGLDLN